MIHHPKSRAAAGCARWRCCGAGGSRRRCGRGGSRDRTDVFAYLEAPVAARGVGRTTPEPRHRPEPDVEEPGGPGRGRGGGPRRHRAGPRPRCGCASPPRSWTFLRTGVTPSSVPRSRDLRSAGPKSFAGGGLVGRRGRGAGSGTRRAVGIEMVGPPCLAVMLNEYVRADLSSLPVAKEAAVIMLRARGPGPAGDQPAQYERAGTAGCWSCASGPDRDERERPFDARRGGGAPAPATSASRTPRGHPAVHTSVWAHEPPRSPRRSGGAVCCSPVTPPTASHPPAGSGSTAACRTPTTWPGSSPTWCGASPRSRLIDSYDLERRPVAGVQRRPSAWPTWPAMPLVERAMRSGDP